ncbi:hypothetical protein TH25_16370 [Thalassospira profundimaris]|uniref:Uncharacterized protein n=1 Tax=Thalassospira profundimaris TaxID=502049 RepID=A0A367X072_9PROT|nr:hypothetical protein [Thalassospira profundimaris]RCK47083.1 hypothetical protein TH25_16370 [Thalassospira profundimaris]
MSKKSQHPPLGDIPETTAFEIVASGFGAIPVIGPTIQTVLNKTIPNIRAERVETYLRYLQDQIDELKLKLALERPEGLDLFEEGLWQSARAVSEKRKKYIQSLVADGLNNNREHSESQYYLRLLTQLGDDDIIRLWDELTWFRDHPNATDEEKAKRWTGFSETENARRLYLASFGLLKAHATYGGGNVAGEPTEVCKKFLELVGLWV